ncbi:TasA family protein [Arthrobacter monumenti]
MKTTSGKLLASAALLGTAAAVAGLGTYGAFTDSTAANADVSLGTVDISLGDPDDAVAVAIADVLPGDTIEQLVTLSNTGVSDLASISLTTTSTATAGLDLSSVVSFTIDACSGTWVSVPSGADTCSGTTTPIVSSTTLAVTNQALTGLSAVDSGESDQLRIAATLSDEAGNEYQGAMSDIAFTFDASQRTGSTK